jgi:hypothetical protein
MLDQASARVEDEAHPDNAAGDQVTMKCRTARLVLALPSAQPILPEAERNGSWRSRLSYLLRKYPFGLPVKL